MRQEETRVDFMLFVAHSDSGPAGLLLGPGFPWAFTSAFISNLIVLIFFDRFLLPLNTYSSIWDPVVYHILLPLDNSPSASTEYDFCFSCQMAKLRPRRCWFRSSSPGKSESHTFKRTPQRCCQRSQNLESSTCGKEKTQEATGMLQARENEEKDKKLQA